MTIEEFETYELKMLPKQLERRGYVTEYSSVSEFVENTTDNMITILKNKIKENKIVLQLLEESGKDIIGVEKSIKEFETTLNVLETWNGCFN